MSGTVNAVTYVEVEAALLRVERGEATHDDANLLRVIIRGLEGRIRQYETFIEQSSGDVAEAAVQPAQSV